MESEQNSSTLRHYLNLYVRISGGPLDHSRMLGQLDPNRTLSVGSDDEAARLHQVCKFCGCVAITVHHSCSSPSRFASSSALTVVTPVTFPPGR
jgi:hypothetical protein